MRSRLNPDGTKIRNLRIQRGWTQDQLADIAGISSRTIQRAETADSAAFETVRAIAGAFETDFDQLLKHNAEPPVPDSGRAPGSALGIEPIAINSAKPALLRHRWATSVFAVSMLFLGGVAGVILTPHLEMGRGSENSAVPGISASPSPQVERPEVNSLHAADLPESLPTKKVPNAETNLPKRHQNPDLEESSETSVPKAPVSRMANPDPAAIIEHPQMTASLHDLLPRSQEPLPALVISESSFSWNYIPVLANNPKPDEPDSGVLREAMNTAVKKTGAFVSKAGESIKRVF